LKTNQGFKAAFKHFRKQNVMNKCSVPSNLECNFERRNVGNVITKFLGFILHELDFFIQVSLTILSSGLFIVATFGSFIHDFPIFLCFFFLTKTFEHQFIVVEMLCKTLLGLRKSKYIQ